MAFGSFDSLSDLRHKPPSRELHDERRTAMTRRDEAVP